MPLAAETPIIWATTGRVPTKTLAKSSEIWRLLTLSLQPHLHVKYQPAQRPFPPHGSVVKPRELPRRPLGHIDRESLHEAQRHIDLVAGEGQLEVPERAHDVLGRREVGQLSGFDLQRDDGVEVFEFFGGEGAGDEGGSSDEACDSDTWGRGRGGRTWSQGRGGFGWQGSTLEVSSSRRRRDGHQGWPCRFLQEPQAEGNGDGKLCLFVESIEGIDPKVIREG